MNSNINEEELKLLAYLHERASGYGEIFAFEVEPVRAAIGSDLGQLWKSLSYLHEHGLAGMTAINTSTMNRRSHALRGLWLTGLGEDCMRELESQPGIAKT